MARIFISYRRTDSQGWAGRLREELARLFGDGALFFDIETIEAGDDFAGVIDCGLAEAEIVIVLVGPGWLSASLPDGRRRLDVPNDAIVTEIATALARNIKVIPVLLAGTMMPRADELPPAISSFVTRQALELSDTRWNFDCGRLADAIELHTSLRRVPGQPAGAGAVIRVAERLTLDAVQAGDIAGVKGGRIGADESVTVEVAKGATIRNSTIGDIVGVTSESNQKKEP